MSIRIFVSHSSNDGRLASAMVHLIEKSLAIASDEIRCTSLPGYQLATGAETDKQLRHEINTAPAFIALLTPSSLKSVYVQFEMGARWGADLRILPILANGAKASDLDRPLSALNARSWGSSAEVHQLLGDIAGAIEARIQNAGLYEAAIQELFSAGATLTTTGREMETCDNAVLSNEPRGRITLSARDICLKIRNAPPLQQKQIEAEFLGYTVEWETHLSGALILSDLQDAIELSLKPWEPYGYEMMIRCETTLNDKPQLRTAEKGYPIHVSGTIASANGWEIMLKIAAVRLMTEEEKRGTRISMLTTEVRSSVGHQLDISLPEQTILDTLKAQLRMNRVPGFQLTQDRIIIPEMSEGSDAYKLLILYSTKQIIQSCRSLSTSLRRDRTNAIEMAIHRLENGPMFSIL